MRSRLLAALILGLTALPALADPTRPAMSTDWKEVVPADETERFDQAARTIADIQKQIAAESGSPVLRGFHAKAHTALLAEFQVVPGLPEYARYGIFRESKSFKAWVRFSNGVGLVQGDRKPDVRGIAIKVIGAQGTGLLEGEENAHTQDFLMTNNPVQVRNADQFVAFAKANVDPRGVLPSLIKALGLKEALRIAKLLSSTALRPIKSVAAETYWTAGPLKFGPYAVKCLVRPSQPVHASLNLLGSKDYLREELQERLKKEDIRFDFLVQYYRDPELTPMEDSSIQWLETSAPR